MAKKKSKAELQAELSQKAEVVSNDVAQTSDAPVAETKAVETAPEKEPAKQKGPGKIAQILAHFKSGMSTKEISKQPVLNDEGQPIPTGEKDAEGNPVYETFHPTTISIQVNKYKKAHPELYPAQPPAPTKKEIAAAKKAAKEAAEKENAEAGAVASSATE